MSKADKLLAKLRAKPAPRDFKWGDLVTLLARFGFAVDKSGGGSHFNFYAPANPAIVLGVSRSHPNDSLKGYQIKDVLNFLEEQGLIDEHS